MALSYKDSQKQMQNQETPSLMMFRAVPPLRVSGFQISDKYEYYNNYSDDNVSTITANKDIVVKSTQINITQESNSQFIPFEMNRFYDGIDLMEMTLKIHFVNAEEKEYYSDPINVSYDDSKIKFGWLVDKYVTCVVGKVKFEIIATGVNEKGDEYIWRTKPNGTLNILESLTANGVIDTSLEKISNEEIDTLFN